jgi:flagellar biosynthesis/type III secretory pathway protein FliH
LPKLPEISKEDVRKLADAVFKAGEKAFLVAKDALFASLEFVGDHVVRPVVTWFTRPSVDAEAMRQAELKRRAEYERRRTLELARQHKAMMRAQNEQARIMVDRIIAEGTARAIQQDQMEKQELMRRYQQAITPRMPGR